MENMEETIEESILGYTARTHKDRLFRRIFGAEDERSARWRLELYNALSGANHTNPKELEITTLEDVIYIKMKNDISFLVDSQMSLWEHQSTLNPNMPLRGLFYFAFLYQKYLVQNDVALFSTNLVKIPAPHYIVFYNGNEETCDLSKLRLSDAFLNFEEEGDFEWTATMININKNHNERLHKSCKPLYDYCEFVDRIKNNLVNKMENNAAIEEAIEWAIKNNLLEGFIQEHRAEVKAMLLTEFDQEQYDRIRRQEGFSEGLHQKAQETAINMLKKNYPAADISEITGLPLEKVLELQKTVLVQA